MMTIQMIGREVHNRRQAVGLTQARLAKLAHLSRITIQQLEAGTIRDLSFQRLATLLGVLGLSFDRPSTEARKNKNGLWMAARTSSVSYRREMTSDQLQEMLKNGQVIAGLESNMLHFLDEAPNEIVVMAVEEVAQQHSCSPTHIWSNLGRLAKALGASRQDLWA